MKRVFSVLLALALVLSLSGCVSERKYYDDIEKARKDSQSAGYEHGYENGLRGAYDGIDMLDYDCSKAYNNGYDDGYEDGHETGMWDGAEAGYGDAYDDGYQDGFAAGSGLDDSVYVIAGDKTFHQRWCSHVGYRYIIVSIDEAMDAGFEPCSNCNL